MEFIINNLSSILIGAAILIVCVFIVIAMIKNRGNCSCGCGSCAFKNECHKKNTNEK